MPEEDHLYRFLDEEIDYNLYVLLNQARDTTLRARANELSEYGISAIEALALSTIFDLGDNSTPADISRRMFREHNTVTALLDRMGKKGLVAKARDIERKNIWRVALTEKGRDAYHNSRKRESLHTVMSVLSEDEKRQLELLLKNIRAIALKQLATEPVLSFP